jgi:hypothetical protein
VLPLLTPLQRQGLLPRQHHHVSSVKQDAQVSHAVCLSSCNNQFWLAGCEAGNSDQSAGMQQDAAGCLQVGNLQ